MSSCSPLSKTLTPNPTSQCLNRKPSTPISCQKLEDSDSYATIANVGVVFAQTDVGMGFIEVILLAILAPIMCILGVWFGVFLQQNQKWNSYETIVFFLCLLSLFPLWGVLGYIEAVCIWFVLTSAFRRG